MIPPSAAAATRDFVSGLPLALSGGDFPGGHEIRPAELQQAVAWLEALTVS